MKLPVKTKAFTNSPGRFFHYEPFFTSSFSQKFNDARSGNVFKKLKCFQLFYKWNFTESSMIMSFLRSCKTDSTSPSQPGAIRSITIPWWASMVVMVAMPSYASKINFRKQISLRSTRRNFFTVFNIDL